jgi:hypothetical protein
MLKWYRLLVLVWFFLAFSIAFASDVNVTVEITPTTTTIPSFGLRATMLAIAQINPLATLLIFLMPLIIGEGIINAFESIKLNEPLKAAIRLLILIISLALFAAIF